MIEALIEVLVADAETSEREVFEALADRHAEWLDNGGIDALAAEFEGPPVDPTDDLPF